MRHSPHLRDDPIVHILAAAAVGVLLAASAPAGPVRVVAPAPRLGGPTTTKGRGPVAPGRIGLPTSRL